MHLFLYFIFGLTAALRFEKADSKKCKREEAIKVAVEAYRRAWDNYNAGNMVRMALSYQPGAQFTFNPDFEDCSKTVSVDLVQAFTQAFASGDRGEFILKAVEWNEYDRTVKIRSTDLHGPYGQNLTSLDAQVLFSADYGCNYKAYHYTATSLHCLK